MPSSYKPQSQLEVLRSSIAFIIVCYVLLVTWKEILQNFRLWCYSQYYDVTQNKMLKIESGWYVGLREWKIPFHSCFLSSCGYILSRLYQSLSYLSSELVFILSKKKNSKLVERDKKLFWKARPRMNLGVGLGTLLVLFIFAISPWFMNTTSRLTMFVTSRPVKLWFELVVCYNK